MFVELPNGTRINTAQVASYRWDSYSELYGRPQVKDLVITMVNGSTHTIRSKAKAIHYWGTRPVPTASEIFNFLESSS